MLEPPLDPVPATPTERPELVEEDRLGTTPGGRAANGALLAFSRAARGLLLYDPRHAAIRASLDDLCAKVADAVRVAGPLTFDVRRFEIRLADEVVYVERDRERSLAFRLFRDGVRRLVIRAEVDSDEVLRLLEIFAVRYAGVGENEEDVVTRLRRSGFRHVEIAVGGLERDEENAGAGGPSSLRRVEVPADWDLPVRRLEASAPVEYRPVPAEDLERLRAEEAPSAGPANAVRLAVEMLWAVADTADGTTLADIEPFIGEVRDFLLAEGAVSHLTTLAREMKTSTALEPTRVAKLLGPLSERRAVEHILGTVPPGAITPPAELVELMDLVPGDHFRTLIELLGDEGRSDGGRRHLRILIEHYAEGRSEAFFARLHAATPAIARDLLRACRRALPDRVLQAAIDMSSHADEGVASEVLRILATAPPGAAVGRALVRMLESPSQELRLAVADVLSGRKEHAAFAPLVRHVERRAHHSLSLREAQSYGEGLARLSPEAALSLFKAWTQPGAGGPLPPPERLLRWAAVSGLAELGSPEAVALIHAAAQSADDELRVHCDAMLTRAQRDGGR